MHGAVVVVEVVPVGTTLVPLSASCEYNRFPGPSIMRGAHPGKHARTGETPVDPCQCRSVTAVYCKAPHEPGLYPFSLMFSALKVRVCSGSSFYCRYSPS